MVRLGITYKVVGYYNPLGNIFPARVFPIYKPSGGEFREEVFYLQVCDEEGLVQDFQEIQKKWIKFFEIDTNNSKFIGVGQEQVYGFAVSESNVYFTKDYLEYCMYLDGLVRGRYRREIASKPISGIEISRIINNSNLEAVFSSLAVVKLSKISMDAAKGWLKSAPISDKARSRGKRSLSKIEYSINRKEDKKDVVCTIFLSKHTYFQGDLINIFSNGKVKIRIGEKFYIGWPVWNPKKLTLSELIESKKEELGFYKYVELLKNIQINESFLNYFRNLIHT